MGVNDATVKEARLIGRALLFAAGAQAGGTDTESFEDHEREWMVALGDDILDQCDDAEWWRCTGCDEKYPTSELTQSQPDGHLSCPVCIDGDPPVEHVEDRGVQIIRDHAQPASDDPRKETGHG